MEQQAEWRHAAGLRQGQDRGGRLVSTNRRGGRSHLR